MIFVFFIVFFYKILLFYPFTNQVTDENNRAIIINNFKLRKTEGIETKIILLSNKLNH